MYYNGFELVFEILEITALVNILTQRANELS